MAIIWYTGTIHIHSRERAIQMTINEYEKKKHM